jgi:hypothetical protein
MTTPDAREIARDLLQTALDAQTDAFPDAPHGPRPEGDAWLDFRVRTFDGVSFDLLTGDASYDPDHRGYWGSGSLAHCAEAGEVEDELEDAIEQALDSFEESRA